MQWYWFNQKRFWAYFITCFNLRCLTSLVCNIYVYMFSVHTKLAMLASFACMCWLSLVSQVAGVVGRADVLAGLFFIGSLLSYRKASHSSGLGSNVHTCNHYFNNHIHTMTVSQHSKGGKIKGSYSYRFCLKTLLSVDIQSCTSTRK